MAGSPTNIGAVMIPASSPNEDGDSGPQMPRRPLFTPLHLFQPRLQNRPGVRAGVNTKIVDARMEASVGTQAIVVEEVPPSA
jgi:hypothetical protein